MARRSSGLTTAVVDLGVDLSGPNRGRDGFNPFVDGAQYDMGCVLEIGQTSCRTVQEPFPLHAGERFTIIVGEGGTLDPDRTPASVGDFAVSWWFVFQPD